jgi:hypothetical protein
MLLQWQFTSRFRGMKLRKNAAFIYYLTIDRLIEQIKAQLFLYIPCA